MKQPAILIPPLLLGMTGIIGQMKILLWLLAVSYILFSYRREKATLLKKLKTKE